MNNNFKICRIEMFYALLFAIICTITSIIFFFAGEGIFSLVGEVVMLILVNISAVKFYKRRKECIK